MSEEKKELKTSETKNDDQNKSAAPATIEEHSGKEEFVILAKSFFRKVDFSGMQKRLQLKELIIIIAAFIIIYPVIIEFQGLGGAVGCFSFMFFSMTHFFIVAYVWYNLCVYSKVKPRLFLTGFALLFVFFGLLSMELLDAFPDDAILFGIAVILFLAIPIFLFIAAFRLYRKAKTLSIYPIAIASAERDTDEYMNGYSQRPVSVDFPEFPVEKMEEFSSFLKEREIVWEVRKKGQVLKLYFPPSLRFSLLPPGSASYALLQPDGKAEVFVSKDDYEFLQVPISYHLLCRKIAERIMESFHLFANGDEAAALRVFVVKKKGKDGVTGK